MGIRGVLHSPSVLLHPNSHYRWFHSSSSFYRRGWGGGTEIEIWVTCPRTLSCGGAELNEVSCVLTSVPGLGGFGRVENCFTGDHPAAMHRCQALCLRVFSDAQQQLPPCWTQSGLSYCLCTVHSTRGCRRCKRSPSFLDFLEEIGFSPSAVWEMCKFLLRCTYLLWISNWHPSPRLSIKSCAAERHDLHSTFLFAADRWQKTFSWPNLIEVLTHKTSLLVSSMRRAVRCVQRSG